MLEHRLPLAVYSYRLDASAARGTWTPFCDYSPEWVALTRGRACGAQVLFIDLPAWDDAFVACENRYADGPLRLDELARSHGFDCSDALWDHLFETAAANDLFERLSEYFDALRGDDEGDEMNVRREAHMAAWIGWALAQERGDVLVVCGGYHAPALARMTRQLRPAEPPPCTVPGDARVGSFLVPFSFKRLDSFAGYASGMPSPAFYQAVWEHHDQAPTYMIGQAVQHLRKIGQVVSAADHTAASVMTQGLARIRGNDPPTRVDTLDGLVSALLKEPLDAPLPWSERSVLPAGTAPFLVELVATYSGQRHGTLAAGTPAPPLVADATRALASVDLSLTRKPQRVRLSCADPQSEPARHILHRLRVLSIAGVELVATPSLARGEGDFVEVWHLVEVDGTLPSLIERAVYGADVPHAARERLRERIAQSSELLHFVGALRDAVLAGLPDIASDVSARAMAVVEREPVLSNAGLALEALRNIARRLDAGMDDLLTAVYERALWLLEAAGDAADVTFRSDDVLAVRSIARMPRTQDANACLERIASKQLASPGLRGACMGALWAAEASEALAARVCASIASPQLGDFLSGLAVTAREEMLASALLDVVDDRVQDLQDEDFLIALPALRRAFSYFPPSERLDISRRILERRGVVMDHSSLLEPVQLDDQAAQVEHSVLQIMQRYGLLMEEP